MSAISQGVVQTTQSAGNVANIDMSIIGLLSHADMLVKLVILLLVIISFWSWSIIFDKFFLFKGLKVKTQKFERLFWSGQLLNDLYNKIKTRADHPMALVFVSAMNEINKENMDKFKMNNIVYNMGVKERISQIMSVTINKEMEKIESGLSFIGSAASYTPFIGLLGTVWGVMHSLQSIAISKNTNLAVVAPGIAEALFATAVGLFAAIPAYMFFNYFTNRVNILGQHLDNFSIELLNLLSREIDEEIS